MEKELPPIVSIIGSSGAGKTTFLTRLIAELKARHHRVAVIKHHRHTEVEIDRPGKDTWRLFQAGADEVLIATPDRMAMYRRLPRDLTPEELIAMLPAPVDLVITEGFKQAGKPAIEVVRSAHGRELVGDLSRLIALVTDQRYPLTIPHFELDDAAGVADFLEHHFNLPQLASETRPPEEH